LPLLGPARGGRARLEPERLRLFDPDEGATPKWRARWRTRTITSWPHLDGLPYLDKPIVYFAAAAAMMELFGPTEAAARLPAYLATLATIGLLVWFARRRWGEEAAGSPASPTPPWSCRSPTLARPFSDSTLTLCTTAAIVWFVDERAIAPNSASPRHGNSRRTVCRWLSACETSATAGWRWRSGLGRARRHRGPGGDGPLVDEPDDGGGGATA